ncbi:shikimate kinase [Marinimicrobium alkaliphilum]|uniref:shikimate kinase n=1 Tax=Marinimicrobium alkaliphilum TaxID=2202654 RepID=UPI000DBA8DA0|nr:shikimate kinase [Marinimicrobium alkaliphilum]
MTDFSNSLILIGMPGAGKSTIGLLLAKMLVKDFVDTDILIQNREGKALQEIIYEHDYLKLREIEEQVLLGADYPNHVIATGGSAVYSDAGMRRLKRFGPAVFLDVPEAELQARINNFGSRGVACKPGQSFSELLAERRPLYQRYADITINCRDKPPEQILGEIIAAEADTYADMDA